METKLLKHFSLRATMLVALAFAAFTGAWADETGFTISSAPSASVTSGTFTGSQSETWNWVINYPSGGSTSSSLQNKDTWQIGAKDKAANSATFSTSGIPGTITKIVVSCASYQAKATVSATVGGSDFGTQSQTTGSWTTIADVEFTGSATGNVVVTLTNGASGRAMYIKSITVTYSNGGDTPTPATVTAPVLSEEDGALDKGTVVTISNADENYLYFYTDDETDPTVEDLEATGTTKEFPASGLTINEAVTLKVVAVDEDGNMSDVTTAAYTIAAEAPTAAVVGKFVLVTDASELAEGDEIILVGKNEDSYYAMAGQKSNNRGSELVTVSGSSIVLNNASSSIQVLTLEGNSEDGWYFSTGEGYIYASSSSKNYLVTSSKATAGDNGKATLSISETLATITFQGTNTHNSVRFNYNNGSPLFSCYSGTTGVLTSIYKKAYETVSVSAAGYATYCSENDLDMKGLDIKAYKGEVSGKKLTFTRIYQVPKNTGVLLVSEGAAEVKAPVLGSADAVESILTGVNEETIIDENDYILNAVDGGYGFVKAGSYTTLGAHKAYISASDVAGVKSFAIDLDGDETAIQLIKAVGGDAAIYNLAGQRVSRAQKGIFIQNGKKFIVK